MGTTSTLNRALIVPSWAFCEVDFGGDMAEYLGGIVLALAILNLILVLMRR
jgi:hypothetical protein